MIVDAFATSGYLDTTTPLAPSGLSVAVVSSSSLTASWTLNSANDTGVFLERSSDGGTTWPISVKLAAGTTSHTDTDLLAATTYTYRVTALGVLNNSAPSATASGTTSGGPAPTASFTGSPVSGVTPLAVQFTNSSSNYTSSSWDFGDSNTSTLDSPSHTYASAGTYTVALTVTGPGGTNTQTQTNYITASTPTSPTFSSASINSAGTQLTVNFSVSVTNHTGLTISASGGTCTLSYASGDPSSALVFNTSRTINQGEVVTVAYTAGNIVATSGGASLQNFSAQSVTNNSTQTASGGTVPTVSSATVNSAGTQLTVVMSAAVSGHAGFGLTSDIGGFVALAYSSGDGTATLVYSLSRTIASTESITLTYSTPTPGNLITSSGSVPLPGIAGQAAVNNSTQSAPAAASVPTSLLATGVSDIDVTLTWKPPSDNSDQGVTVQRSPSGAGTYSTLATLSGGTSLYSDIALTPNTAYDYRISTFNAGGSSAWVTATGTTNATGATSADALQAFTATKQSAWRIHLAWTAPTAPSGTSPTVTIYRSADGGVTYKKILSIPIVAGASATYDDYPLTPGTVYNYKIRVLCSTSYGEFSTGSATTDAQGNLPSVPTGQAKIEISDTQANLVWAAAGGATSYKVETAPIPGAGTPDTAVWTQVAQVTANSYTLTTVARTPRYWRLRSVNSNGNSEYTYLDPVNGPDLTVRPPSTGSGGNTYDIGAGFTHTTIASAASIINSLQPGDTLNIHSGTYAELCLFACRGTRLNPITIQGVDDGTGLPVIDGLSATTPAAFTPGNGPTFYGYAAVLFHRLSTDIAGHQPGWITLKKITTQRCSADNSPNTFTDPTGHTGTYLNAAAGVYVASGDHITLDTVTVTSNGDGVFAAYDGTDIRYCADLTIQSCAINGNGKVGSASQHQSYIEAVRTVYQFNWYGAPRTGMSGSHLKDRGTGTIIDSNRFDLPSVRLLDIVECQNSFSRAFVNPDYHVTHVFGNLLVEQTSAPQHYGGDSTIQQHYRAGQLRFYHNTLVTIADSSTLFRTTMFKSDAPPNGTIAINNVWYVNKNTAGGTNPEADLFTTGVATINNVGTFGVNFVRQDWRSCQAGTTFTGVASGTGSFLTNPSNTPDFVDIGSANYNVLQGTTSAASGSRIPADWVPVLQEYVHPQSFQSRALYGIAADLGYKTAATDTTPPTVTAASVDTTGTVLTLNMSKSCSGSSGFSLSDNGTNNPLSYSSGSGTATLTYALMNTALIGDTLTLSYTPGSVTDLIGNALVAFSNMAVTNNSQVESTNGPQIKSTATASLDPAGTSLAINKPSGTVSGDLLIAQIVTISNPAVTAPAGWTLIDSRVDVFGGSKTYIYYLVAGGSEPASYTWTLATSHVAAGGIARINNQNASPIGPEASSAPSSGTSLVAPSVTTTSVNNLVLRFLGNDRGTITVTSPTGTLERWNFGTGTSTGAKCVMASEFQAATGATGTATFTLASARDGVVATLALMP